MFLDVVASSIVFQLDRFPNQGINNGFMVFFNVVLLDMTIILCPLFREEVNCVALLQNGISLVLFILQHTLMPRSQTPGCHYTLAYRVDGASQPQSLIELIPPNAASRLIVTILHIKPFFHKNGGIIFTGLTHITA